MGSTEALKLRTLGHLSSAVPDYKEIGDWPRCSIHSETRWWTVIGSTRSYERRCASGSRNDQGQRYHHRRDDQRGFKIWHLQHRASRL